MELGGVYGAIGGEGVYQFGQIQPSRDEAEVLPYGPEARHRLGLDHLIEAASLRYRDTDVCEGLQEPALAALGSTRPFDDGANLPTIRSVESDDAVGLAEPHVLQHDTLGVVCLRSRQGSSPLNASDASESGGVA